MWIVPQEQPCYPLALLLGYYCVAGNPFVEIQNPPRGGIPEGGVAVLVINHERECSGLCDSLKARSDTQHDRWIRRTPAGQGHRASTARNQVSVFGEQLSARELRIHAPMLTREPQAA